MLNVSFVSFVSLASFVSFLKCVSFLNQESKKLFQKEILFEIVKFYAYTRFDELKIFNSSLYLATVRREIWIPSSSKILVIS